MKDKMRAATQRKRGGVQGFETAHRGRTGKSQFAGDKDVD